jgi:hypothetical protein
VKELEVAGGLRSEEVVDLATSNDYFAEKIRKLKNVVL